MSLPEEWGQHCRWMRRRWYWDFEIASLSGREWKRRRKERRGCLACGGRVQAPAGIPCWFAATRAHRPRNRAEVISLFRWWTARTVSTCLIYKRDMKEKEMRERETKEKKQNADKQEAKQSGADEGNRKRKIGNEKSGNREIHRALARKCEKD